MADIILQTILTLAWGDGLGLGVISFGHWWGCTLRWVPRAQRRGSTSIRPREILCLSSNACNFLETMREAASLRFYCPKDWKAVGVGQDGEACEWQSRRRKCPSKPQPEQFYEDEAESRKTVFLRLCNAQWCSCTSHAATLPALNDRISLMLHFRGWNGPSYSPDIHHYIARGQFLRVSSWCRHVCQGAAELHPGQKIQWEKLWKRIRGPKHVTTEQQRPFVWGTCQNESELRLIDVTDKFDQSFFTKSIYTQSLCPSANRVYPFIFEVAYPPALGVPFSQPHCWG